MRGLLASLAVALVLSSLLTAGCAQSSPPATAVPTAAAKSAEPTKSSEPLKPVTPPTAGEAVKKSVYPEKGKAITWISAFDAGSAFDTSARMMAESMEKDLGVPISYTNRPGAGMQLGMTELALAKPDGYTLGYTTLPQVATLALDPERKAQFTRASFQPVAMHAFAPNIIVVPSNSPYKTVKDLVDAAKAKPGKITISTTGILSDDHLAILNLEMVTGAKFQSVHFTGPPTQLPGLLSGDTNAAADNIGDFMPQLKSGELRVLGIMDRQRSKYFPDVKTMEEQGYKVYSASARNLSMPAGSPADAVSAVSFAIKKVISTPAYVQKLDEMAIPLLYMSPEELARFWADDEARLKTLMDDYKTQIQTK